MYVLAYLCPKMINFDEVVFYTLFSNSLVRARPRAKS